MSIPNASPTPQPGLLRVSNTEIKAIVFEGFHGMRLSRGAGQEVSEIAQGESGRVGSGGVRNLTGRVWRFLKSHGSGLEVFEISRVGSGRVGSGRVGSGHPDSTRPAGSDTDPC